MLDKFLKVADESMRDWIAKERPDLNDTQIREANANFANYLLVAYRIAQRQEAANLLIANESDNLSSIKTKDENES